MHDYLLYEQALLASVPHRFRHDVYNAVKAFERSEVMLHIYGSAVKALPWPVRHGDITFALAAFGSLGRLDGSPLTSDYDVLHLYSGAKNDDVVKLIRQAIRDLISQNKALPFEHRDRIEANNFPFGTSPAYQILSFEELLTDNNEIQALQLLTEGRIILGKESLSPLRWNIARRYGFTDNEHALDLTQLRDALDRLKIAYGKGVIGRLAKENKSLLNRKILKLFALREFSYLATLFSVAETAIATSVSAPNPSQIIRILSAPCMIKLASFANPAAALSKIVNCQSPDAATEANHIVLRYVKNLALRSEMEHANNDISEGSEFISDIRALVVNVLGKYDALLQRLHDPRFLVLIDAYKPDVTTWISEKEFSRILQLRTDLIQSTVVLAVCLGELFKFLNRRIQSPALEDAQKTLSIISGYHLESESIQVAVEPEPPVAEIPANASVEKTAR